MRLLPRTPLDVLRDLLLMVLGLLGLLWLVRSCA